MSVRLLVAGVLFFAASAVGCATVRDAAAECESVVSHEIGTVFGVYERYRDDGLASGLLNESRLALERARWTLYGAGGIPGTAACPRQSQRRADFRDLRDDFETAELLVKELETIRGVRFVKVREETAVWVDATTGEEVPADIARSI